MAGLHNRLRRFVVDDEPIALGLVPVGDAACITDPAFGRGMSLALAHAFAVADIIGAAIDDRRELALETDALTDELLKPWLDDAVAQDRARTAIWQGAPQCQPPGAITMGDVMAAAPMDPLVLRAALRRNSLLDPADALFRDPAVMSAVRHLTDRRVAPAAEGPSRDELLQTSVVNEDTLAPVG
jgi:flavin-dependent dehydrogenase